MSMNNQEIDLSGNGAVYIRVSVSRSDEDTVRQFGSIGTFLEQRTITIPQERWFIDGGWARSTAYRRPEFQKMIDMAEAGRIQWIVLNQLDRFGWKDTFELMYYVHRLREAGCRLHDLAGTDWSRDDIATTIHLVVEGENAKQEPRKISYRTLGAMAEYAKGGEWQGNGRVRLGFDVGCFAAADPTKELWRVVILGKDDRLKVYPDGRTEVFKGRRNFPKHQGRKSGNTERLFLTPSKDKYKLRAVVDIFEKYARECISLQALADYLNDDWKLRTCTGERFQSSTIEGILTDPAYIGRPQWNKTHKGKYNRLTKGQSTEELNLKEEHSINDKDDWIRSSRELFPPLVPVELWEAVQEKLANEPRQYHAPISHQKYLRGLLYCATCGQRMVAAGPSKDKRNWYICGTYQKHVKAKTLDKCPCKRHPVTQEELEPFIQRYLQETNQRIDIILHNPNRDLLEKMEEQETGAWHGFLAGIKRLCQYLMQYHPHEYAAFQEENEHWQEQRPDTEGSYRTLTKAEVIERFKQRGTYEQVNEALKEGVKLERPEWFVGPYIDNLLQLYRTNFDEAKVEAEIARLDAEHTTMTHDCRKLTSQLAIDKTNQEITKLEQQITSLRQQQQDATAVIEAHYRQMTTLSKTIAEAQKAANSDDSESSLRQRAQVYRKIIKRIMLTFVPTGVKGGGFHKKDSALFRVTLEPHVGEKVQYPMESGVTTSLENPDSLIPPLSGLPYKT